MNGIKITIGDKDLDVVIKELRIDMKMNSYAQCVLEFEYSNSLSHQELKTIMLGNNINIYSMDSEEKVIFCGYFDEYEYINRDDVNMTKITAYSYLKLLDLTCDSQSFQNANLTYYDVINDIVAGWENVSFEMNSMNPTIHRPYIRYEETAWKFINRLVSNIGTCVYDTSNSQEPSFMVGSNTILNEYDFCEYGCISGIHERYFEQGGMYNVFSRANYLYYEILSNLDFPIGSRTLYKGYEMVIYEKQITYEKSELNYKYLLGTLTIEDTPRELNSFFTGMSLPGEVIAVRAEFVKVHFDIDEKQDEETAYEYKWTPISGNIFYCPPEIGTRVNIYFQSADERDALAIDCIRKNGNSCECMNDYTQREFATDCGKEYSFTPSTMSLSSSSDAYGNYAIDLLEEIFSISSDKALSIMANEGIEIKAPNCHLECIEDMIFEQTSDVVSPDSVQNPSASITISGDVDCYGKDDIFVSTGEPIVHEFFDDNPTEADEWELIGDILFKAVIGFAVAAVAVGALAFLGVITGGVAAAALIGSFVAVAAVGVCDYIDGNSSSLGSYIVRSVSGAITGAVFAGVGDIVRWSSNIGIYILQNMGIGALSGTMYETLSSVGEVLTGAEDYTVKDVLDNVLWATITAGIAGGIFGGASYACKALFSKAWYSISKLADASDDQIKNALGALRTGRTNVSTQQLYKDLMKIYKVGTRAELRAAIAKDPIKMILNYSNFNIMPGEFASSSISELIQDIFAAKIDDFKEYLDTDYELDYVVTP